MNRFAKIAAVMAVGAMTFTACGGNTEPKADETKAESSAVESTKTDAPKTEESKAPEGGALELTCPKGKVNGGGSSAQDIAMQALTKEYNELCKEQGSQVIYTKSGSGAGIKDFYNKQLQWAGSDSALKDKEKDGVIETEKVKERCGGNEGWNLPLIVGPVAFAYNLDGVDKLNLTPEVVTNIFLGKITKWDAPEIKELNKDAKLPADKINVVYRNDESGTTENVAKYLKAAAPAAFTGEPSKEPFAKVGEGKKGTQAVAEAVQKTKGGFGYMEWKYAKDAQLGVAMLDEVELTAESAGKAMDAAEIAGKGNDLKVKLKYTDLGKDTYPMVMVTYEIVCSKGLQGDEGKLMKDFLTYASSEDAQASLEDQGYAPLPEGMLKKVQDAVKALG